MFDDYFIIFSSAREQLSIRSFSRDQPAQEVVLSRLNV